MNELLKKLAKELEEAGEHEEAKEVEKMVDEPQTFMLDIQVSGQSKEELIENAKKTLTELADYLDEKGAVKEADVVDSVLQKVAYFSPGSFIMDDVKKIKGEFLNVANTARKFVGGLIDNEISDVVSSFDAVCDKLGKIQYKTKASHELHHLGLIKEAGEIDKIAADWKWEKPNYDKYDAEENNKKTYKPNAPTKRTETKHHKEEYEETGEKMLSSRYCPDHLGVSLHRVGEGVYRCPLDGRTYNWEAGWKGVDGKKHPGGSIAGQSETASNVPIPSRTFDPREEVLNRVN